MTFPTITSALLLHGPAALTPFRVRVLLTRWRAHDRWFIVRAADLNALHDRFLASGWEHGQWGELLKFGMRRVDADGLACRSHWQVMEVRPVTRRRPRRRFSDSPRETRPRKRGVRDVEVTWPPAPIVLPREAK